MEANLPPYFPFLSSLFRRNSDAPKQNTIPPLAINYDGMRVRFYFGKLMPFLPSLARIELRIPHHAAVVRRSQQLSLLTSYFNK